MRRTPEEWDAIRTRVLRAVADDTDRELTVSALIARFSAVSETRMRNWLKAAGVEVAKSEVMGVYSDSSKRMKAARKRLKEQQRAGQKEAVKPRSEIQGSGSFTGSSDFGCGRLALSPDGYTARGPSEGGPRKELSEGSRVSGGVNPEGRDAG